jgi:DNA-3-methyladenine glycosylase II
VYQLTRASLREAVSLLSEKDALLKRLYECYGVPPLWQRTQSFDTLVHIILEQKVSLASAHAVMQRVRTLCPGMRPEAFLQLDEHSLRTAGISQRKLSYCRSIALGMVRQELKLTALRSMTNQQVIDFLTSVRGIGPWTAGVYLMMALRRTDAWASGDRALVVSYAESSESDAIPSYTEFDLRAERWRPYRGAAARLLWHAYLQRRNRSA